VPDVGRVLSDPANESLEQELKRFRSAWPLRRAVHRDAEWRYRAGGSGAETVLVLTGALGLAEFSFQQIHLLAPHFRIVAPDYPPLDSLADTVDGLIALLDVERVQRAHVAGGSFGGLLAQALVRRAPERVSSMVLSHTGGPDGRRRRGAGVIGLLPGPLVRAMLNARLGRTLTAADPFWRRFFQEAIVRLTKADIMSRVRIQAEFSAAVHAPEDLADWPGRVLIVEADDDPLIRQAQGERLRALYPRSETYRFRGTGHAAAILEPDAYANVLIRFFNQAI
jgi:pimeloyl-ACP methyl ester carboxylesterase